LNRLSVGIFSKSGKSADDMTRRWKNIKTIIGSFDQRKDLFLSLIDEKGMIISANAHMSRNLHLPDLREKAVCFFDLLHPVNLDDFKTVIRETAKTQTPANTELYIRNGYYHPMKWQVNCLVENDGEQRTYLCVGRKLLDDQRVEKFKQLSEANYQLIVEGLSAGILFQDLNGEFIATNQKTAEIFETSLERLYEIRDVRSLWENNWTITNEHGEKVGFDDTPFMKALRKGTMQSQILIVRIKSGAVRWIHFRSQPLFAEGSATAYSVVSNLVDISYEKNLIAELEEGKALFSAFMSQTPNLAWVVDEHANLLIANKSFCRYFGLDPQTSLHQNLVNLVPAEVAHALYEKHIQVINTGEPIRLVEKIRWADDSSYVFHINLFPIDGKNGKKLVGGHAVNLADKYKAEKQLHEANERLLQLTRATTDAIWEWDMQTGRIFRNDALMEMIGYQLDDPKGLSWWLRRIHPDDRNRVSDKVKDVTEKNLQSWEDEYRFKCADGIYKHMQDRGYIVYENGLPVKMIGSLQDVSVLRNLEDQLTEEKLQRQKEISETVIRVQEKERTRIGHELHDNVNQILSTTKLFVDMLTPGTKEERQIKLKSIEYIMMAIEEIRKLSKELVVPQLQGKGLIDSIWTLVDDIHLSTRIKIKFTHDNETDLLSPGKKVTLFRIVQEQLKNVIKYSEAGKVEIFLECRDNRARLIIKDNGIGFDPSQTPRGIGLSNIYERTRFYNGKVNIETSPRKGCVLTVSIPALD
jgi:PAS domain S-box-containing protein